MTTKPIYTTEQVIQKITFDEKGVSETWPSGVVTYSIGTGTPTNLSEPLAVAAGYTAISDKQLATAKLSFQLWADLVKNIALTELTGAGSTGANITFSYTNTGSSTFSQSSVANSLVKEQTLVADQIWLTTNWVSNSDAGMEMGAYGLTTMIHEIGHGLGLNHPGNYNATDDGPQPTYDKDAVFAQDNRKDTLMSYFWAYDPGRGWVVTESKTSLYPQTPMLYDIATIQHKYGANMSTRADDTVYGFNCSLASSNPEKAIYDFSQNTKPIFAIWDGGGNNTLDCSAYSGAQTIKLTPGEYSSVLGLTENVTIAFGAKIQNAIGGSGNDNLIGENVTATCTLKGGMGDDTIQGLSGCVTTAEYTGAYANYTVKLQAGLQSAVQDSVAGRDGSDALSNVPRLKFTDTMLALDTATGQTGGEAYRLYKAAFDRVPDAQGLGYWISSMDQGASLLNVANAFTQSAEFIAMYGVASSDSNFINLMYQHVLHRAPDQAGNAYWLGELATGHMSRGGVLASFSESSENVQQTATLVANGIQYQAWLS